MSTPPAAVPWTRGPIADIFSSIVASGATAAPPGGVLFELRPARGAS